MTNIATELRNSFMKKKREMDDLALVGRTNAERSSVLAAMKQAGISTRRQEVRTVW
jgi:GTP-binding protein EngB required for normal cell division